ncbi:MAG TPA: hypothetical protein VFM82_10240 [Flavobacteriaceae bacterium]|nr:hypothetical protein [Flavobacteriaceae bacterium]
MKRYVDYPITQIAIFLWIGFVCAISFMEAWLKFQAPGITVPLGLGIGKLVFGGLNTMEWVFAICAGGNLFLAKNKMFTTKELLLLLAVIILFLQTIWLLPALDDRASAMIAGKEVPTSYLHYYYVAFEIIKVGALVIFGTKLYKKHV